VTAETQWSAGRLGAAGGSQRILFGHMHEDAEIEREAFRGRGRVFCIASAGCTAIELSRTHEVVACDINPVQLAYAESRARGGPAVTGDAERVMAFARIFMPLVGWSAGTVGAFLKLSDVDEQLAFWRSHLDTRRFRAGFDTMLSRTLLRLVYSPRLLSVLPDRFGAVLRGRMERGFARHANAMNPWAKIPTNPDRARLAFSLCSETRLLISSPTTPHPSRGSRCRISLTAPSLLTGNAFLRQSATRQPRTPWSCCEALENPRPGSPRTTRNAIAPCSGELWMYAPPAHSEESP